jgi:hypothetical protein
MKQLKDNELPTLPTIKKEFIDLEDKLQEIERTLDNQEKAIQIILTLIKGISQNLNIKEIEID